ncbi:hypothetical protein [Arhodomonas sp. AD133]|uniref:hypothetical protein n=1 Tax=Arhodomonas sp. AD133 TaxID=3415009 RepID=UPI003EB861D9
MTYPVKWFDSDMAGAPTLDANAGSLIALLKACFIDGFNLQALDSLTYDSGSGEVTGTVGNGHGFVKHQVVKIAGADQAEYNGEHRVSWIDSTTFRYTPAAAPAASPATTSGTLEARAAPVGGWEIAHDDGQGTIAAFRSTAPEATGILFRFDDSNTDPDWDSNAADVMVCGAEAMTDIDTYDGAFPSATTRYRIIRKDASPTPTAGGIAWELVADGSACHLVTDPGNDPDNPHRRSAYMFGDLVSYRPGDAYHAGLVLGDENTSANYCTSHFGQLGQNNGHYLARSHTQAPGVVQWRGMGSSLSNHLGHGGLPYPNPADNGLYLHAPVLVKEPDADTLRGEWPGMAQLLQTAPLPHRQVLEHVNGEPVLYLALQCGRSRNSSDAGELLVDLVGPWR